MILIGQHQSSEAYILVIITLVKRVDSVCRKDHTVYFFCAEIFLFKKKGFAGEDLKLVC